MWGGGYKCGLNYCPEDLSNMCLGDMCEGLTCAGQQTGGRVDQAGDDSVSREETEGRWQVMK